MQNKPNLLDAQMNVSSILTKAYENKWQRRVRKNKPNTNPIQTQTNPISEKPKMNLNFYSTKDYENKPPLRAPAKQTQNKPNSNPIINHQSSIITYPPLPQSPHFLPKNQGHLSGFPTPHHLGLAEKKCENEKNALHLFDSPCLKLVNPHRLHGVAVERFCAQPQETLVPASKGTTPFSEFLTHTVCIEKLAMPNVKAAIAYNRMRPTLSLAPFRDLE